MENDNELKSIVKEKYGEIAKNSKSCCCGSSKIVNYTIMKDSYDNLEGYVKEADLGLGCGLPTEFANISNGDIVVDLGSGAGNDVFVARSIVDDSGKVYGIDMTEDMIELANENKAKLGIDNIEFKLGEIEELPLENDLAEVVVSNCVLNLVPNKQKAFSEIYRVLKPGGHFCISDIVLVGELPEQFKKSAEMYAGCVSGALQRDQYLELIDEAGFKDVKVVKTKTVELPDMVLIQYLSNQEMHEYKQKAIGIFSITVYGTK